VEKKLKGVKRENKYKTLTNSEYTMLAHPNEMIVRACALILTPNHDFLEWLKTAALGEQLFPASIDKLVDDEVLYNHSVSFITPDFHGQEELAHFMSQHHEFIFNTLLLAWPFSREAWQQSTTGQNLGELFDVSYYFYLVNMLDERQFKPAGKEVACSVMTLKPKAACFEWMHSAGLVDIEDLELDVVRRFGVALLTPNFQTTEEELHFIIQYSPRIWEIALSCYCDDESLWPQERTVELLAQWFDCETCYSVVDLTKLWKLKKIA
jgi:hypothetical protein